MTCRVHPRVQSSLIFIDLQSHFIPFIEWLGVEVPMMQDQLPVDLHVAVVGDHLQAAVLELDAGEILNGAFMLI